MHLTYMGVTKSLDPPLPSASKSRRQVSLLFLPHVGCGSCCGFIMDTDDALVSRVQLYHKFN